MGIGEVELIMREAGIGTVQTEMGVMEAEEKGMVEAEMGVAEAEEIGTVQAEMGMVMVERQKIEGPGMETVGTGSEIGNGRTRFTSLFAPS